MPERHDTKIADDEGAALVGSDNASDLYGLSDATGTVMWKSTAASGGTVCDVTSNAILLRINGQLAVLNSKTGQQESFNSSQSSCPITLPGGIAVERGGGGLTVTQALPR